MSYDSGSRVRPVLSGFQATALDMSFDETYLFATSNVTNTFKIYMYHESANVWTQEYSTTGPSGFGQDVSCTWDGDLVVVGSPLENNVYVYNSNTEASNIWLNPVLTKIEPSALILKYKSHITPSINFGYSVSLSKNTGQYLAIGAPGDGTPSDHGEAWIVQTLGAPPSGHDIGINYYAQPTYNYDGYDIPLSNPFTASYPVIKDGTDYYYVTDSGHRIGHSVSMSPYGQYLAIGAPGTPVPVINSSNTQHVTTGNPWSGSVNRILDDYLQNTAMLGHIQVWIRPDLTQQWQAGNARATLFITGNSEQDLSTATNNPPYAWDFPSCGEKVKISTDGDYVIGGSPRYGFSGSQGGAHWGKIEAWKYNSSSNDWELSPGRVIGQQPGDRLGKYFDIDFAGKRIACLLLKAPPSYATPYGNTEGGIMVYDFNGQAFFETTTEITDTIGQNGNTDGLLGAICISRGNTLSVSGVNGSIIPSFYFKLTQTIDGNTLSGGYLAADTLVIGPNDGTTNNSYPKKLAFGGTYRDNSYEQTQIENRIYHYDSTNFSEWEQGYSELIFSKKSQREAQDMIRFKTHEFRVDSYVRGDGDYDHHPVITVNQQGLIKLNAEMHLPDNTSVHSTSEMQCNAKALLDIEGDCFTRRRLNIGWPECQNIFGSDKWSWRILYDTRSPRVYNFEGSNQIHSNVIAINNTPWTGKYRAYSSGSINNLLYSEDECAFYFDSSSGYSENTNYPTVYSNSGFAVSFWFKLSSPQSSLTSPATLISFGTPSNTNSTGARIQLTSTKLIINFGTITTETTDPVLFETNKWYHIWIASQSSLINSLYINNVAIPWAGNGTITFSGFAKQFYIGSPLGDSITDCYIGMIAFGDQYNSSQNAYVPTAQDMYLWGPPTQRLVVGGDVDVAGDINFSGNIYQGGVLLPLSPWETNLFSYLYPITAMTSASSGGYTASSSTYYSGSYQSWKAFNHIIGTEGWLSGVDYSGGTYIGTNSTTYNGSSTVNGEWIQLQVPTSIITTRIKIAPHDSFTTFCAKTGKLLGSNDGSTWTEIHSFANQTYTTGEYTDISFTNTNAYTHFRLVGQEISSTSNAFLAISELKIVSDVQWIHTSNNYINSIGIGTNSPNYELDIVGNVNISNDLYVSDVSIIGDLQVSNINVFSTQQTNNVYTSNNAYVNFINRTSNYESSFVVSSDIDVFDGFGTSVSVSGDGNTAVIGTPYTVANSISNGGSVYIFVRSGNTWTQQAKLTSSDVADNDHLGISVSVSHDGNTFITGAFLEDPNSTTNGGSAYVFTRSGTTWTQQAKLVSSDVESNDEFGLSVSISGDGDTAIVGAYREASITPGYPSGSAYVFTRSGTSWSQEAKIIGSGVDRGEQFGESVDISYDGNTVIIGNKSDTVNSILQSGSATVFTRSGTTWTEEGILTASDAGFLNQFGVRVSISDDGNTALVGCFSKDTVYVFTRSGTTWSEEYKLVPWGNVSSTPKFGAYSVSLSGNGNVALVSAPQNSNPNIYTNDGTTYVYVRIGTEWFDHTILSSLNAQNNGFFGSSVSASYDGAISIVGANEETYYSNTSSGSVYTYQFTEGLNYYSRLTVSNDLEVLGNIYGNGTTLTGIALETDMTSNASRISTLETDMTSNASRISTLETDLTSNASRISTLETDMTSNASRISTLETDMTSNASRISTLETDLTSNASRISTLETDLTSNASRISTLETDMTSNASRISTLETDMTSNASRISTLETDMTSNASRISTLETLTLEDIANNGNTTSNTIQFTNTSTSLVTSSNVGIGTSAPSYKLDVAGDISFTGALRPNGSAGTSGQVLTSSGSGAPTWQAAPGFTGDIADYITHTGNTIAKFGFPLNDTFVVYTSNLERIRINGLGNVGIGTTGPNYKLHVVGDINFTGTLRANGSAGTSGQVLTSSGTSSAPTWTTIASSPWSTLNSNIYYNSGSVGIGTTTPSSNLEVKVSSTSSASNPIAKFTAATTNGGYNAYTQIEGWENSALNFYCHNFGSDFTIGYQQNFSVNGFVISAGNTLTSNPYFYVDLGGNVGIGTTSPAYKLDVVGTSNFTGALYANGSAGTSGQVLTSSGTGSAPTWTTVSGGSSPWTTSGSDIYYSGNVGIGMSTAPYSGHKLDIVSNNQAGLSIYDSSSAKPYMKFYTGGYDCTMGLDGIAGQCIIKRSSTFSANDVFNLNLTTGNLGLGTTSPGYKLHVVGDINFTGTLYQNGSAFSGGGSSVWTTSGSNIYYNSGNVGIGTTTPSGQFEVYKNASVNFSSPLAMFSASSGSGYDGHVTIRGYYNTSLTFWNDSFFDYMTIGYTQLGANGFRISPGTSISGTTGLFVETPTGNVGIGTTGPNYNLHVVGDINFTGALRANGSAGTAGYVLTSNGTSAPTWQAASGGGSSVWTTSGSNIYYNSGYVGIGTSSPYRLLDVSTTGTYGGMLLRNGDSNQAANGSWPQIQFGWNGTSQYSHFIRTRHNSSTTDNGIDFYVCNGTSNNSLTTGVVHALTIDIDGIGIGTMNPTYDLHVLGDINFTGTLYQNGSVFSGGGGSSVWTTSGSNIYYNSGNVSIGTSSSNGKLYIEPSGSTQTANAIYVYNPNNSAGQDAILTLRVAGSSAGDAYIAFDINGWASWACGVDTSDNHKFKWSSDWGDVGSNTKMTLDRYSGNLGIGTTSPSYKLDVAGDIYATGNVTAYSDLRSKKNLKTIEDPVSKIEKINGYTYEKDGIAYTGLVAQELLEVLPEAVSGSEELGYGIAYGNMAGIFVEAIKELNSKIKELGNKLSECKT